MVSLFEKSHKLKHGSSKPMSLTHQEFLKRIKKSLYLGPSNPERMTSQPMANLTSLVFTDTHRNYSLNTLDMDTISRIKQQTPASLILSIIYLDRLNKLDPVFAKTITPTELFLVTLMVSTKFYADYDELDVFTRVYAEEGSITAERLAQLEISFLQAIQWNLFVSKYEFHEKLKTVERLLAMKEGLSRGWYTYTELELLMPSLEIAKRILNYTTILMFSYACSIATLALSGVILASIPATTTDLSQRTNQTTSTTTSCDLTKILAVDEVRDNELMMGVGLNLSTNFTIFYPLLDEAMNWKMRRNYQDDIYPDTRLAPSRLDPVRLHW